MDLGEKREPARKVHGREYTVYSVPEVRSKLEFLTKVSSECEVRSKELGELGASPSLSGQLGSLAPLPDPSHLLSVPCHPFGCTARELQQREILRQNLQDGGGEGAGTHTPVMHTVLA
jgi:hypothetical protein